MQFPAVAKILMALGATIFLVGVLVFIGSRLGLGRLPGDVSLQRGNWSFHLPIVTSIVLSIVLTIVINVLMRFFR